jgi:hypothetical protein
MDSSIVGTSLRCRGAVVTTWRFGFINTERTVPAFNNNYNCSSSTHNYSPGAYAGAVNDDCSSSAHNNSPRTHTGAVGRLHRGIDSVVGNDY